MHNIWHAEAWLHSVADAAGAKLDISDTGVIFTFPDGRFAIFRRWEREGFRIYFVGNRTAGCTPPFGPRSYRGDDGLKRAAAYVRGLVGSGS